MDGQGRCRKIVYFLKLMDFGVGGNELLGMDATKKGFVKGILHFFWK